MASLEQDISEGLLTQLIGLMTPGEENPPGEIGMKHLRQAAPPPVRFTGQEPQDRRAGQEVCRVIPRTPEEVSSQRRRSMDMGRSPPRGAASFWTFPFSELAVKNTVPPKLTNWEEEEAVDGALDSPTAPGPPLLRISSSSSSAESLECRQPEESWEGDLMVPATASPQWHTSSRKSPHQEDVPSPGQDMGLYHSPNLFSDKESSEPSDQSSELLPASQDEQGQEHGPAESCADSMDNTPESHSYTRMPCLSESSFQGTDGSIPLGQGKKWTREMRKGALSSMNTMGGLCCTRASCVDNYDPMFRPPCEAKEWRRTENGRGREAVTSRNILGGLGSPRVSQLEEDSCQGTATSYDIVSGQRKEWRKTIGKVGSETMSSDTSLEDLGSTAASGLDQGTKPFHDLEIIPIGQGKDLRSAIERKALKTKVSLEAIYSTGPSGTGKAHELESFPPGQEKELRKVTGREVNTKASLEDVGSTGASGTASSHESESLPPGQTKPWRTKSSRGREAFGSSGASRTSGSRDLASLSHGHGEDWRKGIVKAALASRTPMEALGSPGASGTSSSHDFGSLPPGQGEDCRKVNGQVALVSRTSLVLGGHSPFVGAFSDTTSSSHLANKVWKQHSKPGEQGDSPWEAQASHAAKRKGSLLTAQWEEPQMSHHTDPHRSETGRGSLTLLGGLRKHRRVAPWHQTAAIAGKAERNQKPLEAGQQSPGHPSEETAQHPELLNLILQHPRENTQVHPDRTPFRYLYPAPTKTLLGTAQGLRCPEALIHWAIDYLSTTTRADTGGSCRTGCPPLAPGDPSL